MTASAETSVSIAVIGGSVRGTSLVERVLASAPDIVGDRALTVHVIDPHPPGSGRIWRAGQAQELIMNTVAAQSTLFTDDTVDCAGPVRPGPNLAEWCRLITADPHVAGESVPAAVRSEAAAVVDWSNPSRLLYGYYLRWCFRRVIQAAPPGVDVQVHAARAIDIDADGPRYEVHLDDGTHVRADAVLLALGWLERDDVPQHPRVFSPGNPIDQDLSAIASGEVVAVRGLGMGFFDTLSQLTEQRGGRFVELGDGSYRYERGGREPVLFAGSSRGVPFRAKPDFGAPPFFPEQRILRGALPLLIENRPVDFASDVLPLIERDAAYDYYRALDRVRPGSVRDAAELLRALHEGRREVDELVAEHVPIVGGRLSLRDAEDPLNAVDVDDTGLDSAIASIVRRDIDEAALGLNSPLKLALHSYAAARSAVISLVEFGGLTASSYPSYRRFLKVAASYGSGPPLRRARHLLAAHDAGVVHFLGPRIRVDIETAHALVQGPGGTPVRADRVVEAWLPPPSVAHTSDPLLTSLVRRGLAREWRFDDGSSSDALDVRPSDGALIGIHGDASPGLFSVGVPHEDIRVFTIVAPVPATNSSVLRETDAAARAALRFTAREHEATSTARTTHHLTPSESPAP